MKEEGPDERRTFFTLGKKCATLSTSNAVLSRLKLSSSFDGSSYLSNIHKFLKKASKYWEVSDNG